MDDIDVFISHASGDRPVADSVCLYLERQGFRCWIAHRDIGSALSWLEGAVIDQAIQRSRLVLVVFTKRADRSVEVSHELSRAVGKQIPVLAVRVAGAVPLATQELSRAFQWVESANPPTEAHLQSIRSRIVEQIGSASGAAAHAPSAVAGRAPDRLPPLPHAIDVFISYKSEDTAYAKRIYELLVAGGLAVFFSRESLPRLGSDDYHAQIDLAVEQATHMVVVTTSHAHAMAQWVQYEWRLFLGERLAGRKGGNLVTVIAGEMRIEDLPISLRNREVIAYDAEGFDKLLEYTKR